MLHYSRLKSGFRFSNNVKLVTPHGKKVQRNHQMARSKKKLCKAEYTAQVSVLLCSGNFILLTSIYCKWTSASGRHVRRQHPTLRGGWAVVGSNLRCKYWLLALNTEAELVQMESKKSRESQRWISAPGRTTETDSSWNVKAHCLENDLNGPIFAPAVSLVCSK